MEDLSDMNTFVVKSNNILKAGQYIGLSYDDQYVFIYRSHEMFKLANPELKSNDYAIVKDLKKENFDFKKNNICPVCGGLKAWYHVAMEKPMGKVFYDELGFTKFSEEINVHCSCKNGTYIGYLEHELKWEKRDSKEKIEELSGQLLNIDLF